MKQKAVTVWLDEDLYREARKALIDKDKTFADFVRESLRQITKKD